METQKDYSSEKLRTFADGERELIRNALKSRKLKGENGADSKRPQSSLSCKKCGYMWASRVNNPVECPSCKSRYWQGEEANG